MGEGATQWGGQGYVQTGATGYFQAVHLSPGVGDREEGRITGAKSSGHGALPCREECTDVKPALHHCWGHPRWTAAVLFCPGELPDRVSPWKQVSGRPTETG